MSHDKNECARRSVTRDPLKQPMGLA